MAVNSTQILVILPSLILLGIGWLLVVVGFGKIHYESVRSGWPREYADYYVNEFLQFWIYVLGVPAVAALVVMNEVCRKFTGIVEVIKCVTLCVVAMVLGGCMSTTIFSYIRLKDTDFHFVHFYTVALAGEVISVLPLIYLYSLAPFIIKKLNRYQLNRSQSYQQLEQ